MERELARGTGPFTSSDGLYLTVDNDKPTTIIALDDNQYLKVPSDGGSETLIIGGFACDGTVVYQNGDPTCDSSGVGVQKVEVSANGFSELANGTDIWAHSILVSEGKIDITAIATDSLGNRGNRGRTATVYGDGTPPTISANLPPDPILPTRSDIGSWLAPIQTSVQDPLIAGTNQPGSGEYWVEVQLESSDGADFGWQYAEYLPIAQDAGATQSIWEIDYEVPAAIGDPTGSYTVTIRTADYVGNENEKVVGQVHLLIPDIEATIRQEDADLEQITDARPLAGAITSVTGISNAEAAFVPIDQILVFSDTVVSLPFDEPAGSLWFDDATVGNHDAYCAYGPPCPTAGQPGQVDGALQFFGNESLEVVGSPELDAVGSGDFTIQAWFKTGVKEGSILSKVGGDGLYLLWIDDSGRLNFDVSGKDGNYVSARSNGSVASDTWYHVAAMVKHSQGEAILYLNGVESAYTAFDGDVSNDDVLEIGIGFNGLIDDVMLINHALSYDEIQSFADPANRSRLPVNLTPTSGTEPTGKLPFPAAKTSASKASTSSISSSPTTTATAAASTISGVAPSIPCPRASPSPAAPPANSSTTKTHRIPSSTSATSLRPKICISTSPNSRRSAPRAPKPTATNSDESLAGTLPRPDRAQ